MSKCFYILATGFDDWAHSIPVAMWETNDESDGSGTCARLVLGSLEDEFREVAPSRTFSIAEGTFDDTAALWVMEGDAQGGLYGDEVLDVCQTAQQAKELLERLQSIKESDCKDCGTVAPATPLHDELRAVLRAAEEEGPATPDDQEAINFLRMVDGLLSLPYKPLTEPLAPGESEAMPAVPGSTVAGDVADLLGGDPLEMPGFIPRVPADPDVVRLVLKALAGDGGDAAAATAAIAQTAGNVTPAETEAATDQRTRPADNPKRKLNDEARACINAFKRRQKTEPDVKMKPFCAEYAKEKEWSFDSLYRTITDNPDAWKSDPPADKPADKHV